MRGATCFEGWFGGGLVRVMICRWRGVAGVCTHQRQLSVVEDAVGVLAHLAGEDHGEEAAHGGHVLAGGGLGAVCRNCVQVEK